uniref:Transcription factor HES-5 n=1 Tax=Pelusios castaneus TaxID=367368 RepID=A0A8C8SNG0_9SAUR
MAPSNSFMVHVEEQLLPKEKNKLRKPVVEKMRRDRINSSIEQLKLLLEKEFQRHQPNSKLEKADILEVAVSYLKQQNQLLAHGEYSPEQDFNMGYLQCLKEALHFLSYCETKKEGQTQLIKHFCKAQMIPDNRCSPPVQCPPPLPCLVARKHPAQKNIPAAAAAAIWRPW